MKNNNKGIALIFALFIMLVVLGISGILMMRTVNTGMMNQVNSNSLQAFYEADAGLNFAYAEEAQAGFNWYTHTGVNVNTRIIAPITLNRGTTSINFVPPVLQNLNARIDGDGNYTVNGRTFSVKAFPEEVNGLYSGIIVIHSQAIVNGITRTLEYRLSQVSPYEYFFFYPGDKVFEGGFYDGRNYAGVHVNGNILLRNSTTFAFLTKLTSGSNIPGHGYIYRQLHDRYPDLAPNGSNGESSYNTTLNNVAGLPLYMRTYADEHFFAKSSWQSGTATFKTGLVSAPTVQTLNYYLDADKYSGAEWDYKKYSGSNTTPVHYVIENNDLKNVGLNELTKGEGSVALFDAGKTANIPGIPQAAEKDVFKELLNKPAATQVDWDNFWGQWKVNHQNDYQAYHGATITGCEDWERKAILAAYNWPVSAGGVPTNINREWWEDLQYGNDRTSADYMAPAKIENSSTGLSENKYFLDTEKQAAAWAGWLNDNNLNTEAADKTLIKDRSQGGVYIDPGKILGKNTSSSALKEKALHGGIYIGKNTTTGICENPIASIAQAGQFYNSARPARDDSRYVASNVLRIDVAALRARIIQDQTNGGPLANFNGVIYVDRTDCLPTGSDIKAAGVMLFNGSRVPDGGLSLATPNNVFIKGDYNLDPDGVPDKNRTKDDPVVTDRYKDRVTGRLDLKWQPTEIITQREIYTLSNDFPEPTYMPMAAGPDIQYEDEKNHVPEQDVISSDKWWPSTETWVPNATVGVADSKLDKWFKNYRDAAGNPVPIPSKWGDKVGSQFFADKYFPYDDNVYYGLDTDGDNKKDTYYTVKDLRADAYKQITTAYSWTFSYASVHGSDPKNPVKPDTASLINKVTQKCIYNTAIMTPYGTEPSVLENWVWGSRRVINGAFIQLDYDTNALSLRNGANSRAISSSSTDFQYESRLGRNSIEAERPRSGVVFGVSSSWREINNDRF